MNRRGGDLDGLTVAAASVMVHAFIGLVMWGAIDAFVTRRPVERETIIEIVEEEEKPPEPEVKLPEPPPPPPEPEPLPEPEPIPPTRVEPEPERAAVRDPAPPTTEPPPIDPSPSTEPPSPGPPTGETSAPVIALPELGVDTTGVPVARGKRPPRVGAGGGGTSTTGGGGGTEGEGTSPKPVSIAALKRRAKAASGQDYFDASKDYPDEARRNGIEGKIRVKVEISPEGAVSKATLLNKLGHGLDELARDRAKKLRFEPAIDGDDRPVASVEVWTFTFAIPD